jgi:hypothetical protein
MPCPVIAMVGNIANQRSQGNGCATAPAQGVDFTGSVPCCLARHYLIAGTVTDDPEHLASKLWRLRRSRRRPGARQAVSGVGHMRLAHDEAV